MEDPVPRQVEREGSGEIASHLAPGAAAMHAHVVAAQAAAAQRALPLSQRALQRAPLPPPAAAFFDGQEASGASPVSSNTLAEVVRFAGEPALGGRLVPPPAAIARRTAEAYRHALAKVPLAVSFDVLLAERQRLVDGAVAQRIAAIEGEVRAIREEEASTGGEAVAERDARVTRLLVEAKGLALIKVQRQLREQVLAVSHEFASVNSHIDRSLVRRKKKISLREARMTERLEQQERRDRLRRERQGYYDHLQSILNHGRDLQGGWRTSGQKRSRLLKQVLAHHGNFEREEQKRIERLSTDRLRALKADDEEGYLKLLDQQKDTRLTFLLRQTNEFLCGLTAKVVAQQEETAAKIVLDAASARAPLAGGEPFDRLSGARSASTLTPPPPPPAAVAGGGAKNDEDAQELAIADYFNTAHRVQEVVTEQPRIMCGGKLKEYQMKGLQWMVSLYNNHLNGILADEMGLGKTIQTISLISYLMETKGQMGPFLIIVPLSTMTNWSIEFDRWAPTIVRIDYKGMPAQRKLMHAQIKHGKFNVLLTTYEYIIKDKAILSKIRWLYLIVDEGHRMKNAHSKLTMVLSQYYQMRLRLILTGTPLQNSLPELWALLNFLLPHIFNSCKSFEEWFNAPFANTGEKVELNEEEMLLIIRRLHKVLRPFLLRRMKKDVESELPDKVEIILKCPMSALQQTLYNSVAKHTNSTLQNTQALGLKKLNNTIMQLRKICNHPFVFPEVEGQFNPYQVNNDMLHRVAGKFELLHRILPKFKATGHKILLFFQMTQIMTIMEDMLVMMGYRYLRLDGSTKAEDRTASLKLFNDPESPYFVFLLSTRAGGLGLNLQSADTVIIFDSDWNPHQDLQAQDRAHRIGQTKEVRIFRLITIDSVEEYILERAQHKLNLDGKIIQAGKFDHKSTNEERDELLRAVMERECAEADADAVYGDDELNEILSRSEEELATFQKLDAAAAAPSASSGRGGKHTRARLMEASELPAEYLKVNVSLARDEDSPSISVDGDDGDEEGGGGATLGLRSSRIKNGNAISYNENISDAKWLAQLGLASSSDDGDADDGDYAGGEEERVVGGGGGDSKRKRSRPTKSAPAKERGEDAPPATSGIPLIKFRLSAPREGTAVPPSSTSRSVKGGGGGGDSRNRRKRPPTKVETSNADSSASNSKSGGRLKIPLYTNGRARAGGKRERVVDRETCLSICRALFDLVENCTEESPRGGRSSARGSGRYRSDLFIDLPDRALYPDYYQVVKKPICLSEIEAKLEKGYARIADFTADMGLMFSNAMLYNSDDSQVYEDAQVMRQLMNDKLEELLAADGHFSPLQEDGRVDDDSVIDDSVIDDSVGDDEDDDDADGGEDDDDE